MVTWIEIEAQDEQTLPQTGDMVLAGSKEKGVWPVSLIRCEKSPWSWICALKGEKTFPFNDFTHWRPWPKPDEFRMTNEE